MQFFDLIVARRSVRSYRDLPLDWGLIQQILNTVTLAPSAGDLQAYQIVVVTRHETKVALAAAALGQEFIVAAPAVFVFFADLARSRAKYGQRGASLFCVQDATIAAAYAQLAATELGLASCWVGAFEERPVAKALAAPENQRPVVIMPIGYAAEAPAHPPRRSLESFVFREGF